MYLNRYYQRPPSGRVARSPEGGGWPPAEGGQDSKWHDFLIGGLVEYLRHRADPPGAGGHVRPQGPRQGAL